jgi:hypothetical protein
MRVPSAPTRVPATPTYVAALAAVVVGGWLTLMLAIAWPATCAPDDPIACSATAAETP